MLKLGKIKIKRNYTIMQMVLDAVSAVFLVFFWQVNYNFYTTIIKHNETYPNMAIDKTVWIPTFIWGILAVIFTVMTVLYTFKNRRIPKKYSINEENAQKYVDIINTTVYCLRIIFYLMMFECMYIHQEMFVFSSGESLFSVQLLCDVVIVLLLIKFTAYRVHCIEPKEKEKSHEITEG